MENATLENIRTIIRMAKVVFVAKRASSALFFANRKLSVGKLTWPDGHSYEGEFSFNAREGTGVFFHSINAPSLTHRFLQRTIPARTYCIPQSKVCFLIGDSVDRNIPLANWAVVRGQLEQGSQAWGRWSFPSLRSGFLQMRELRVSRPEARGFGLVKQKNN